MRDPLFETRYRYLVLQGKNIIGEVYVMDEKYIAILNKVRNGLSCRKAG